MRDGNCNGTISCTGVESGFSLPMRDGNTMHAAGRVRISFDLRGALHDIGKYYVGPGNGGIYKNGSPAGIERVVYSDMTTRFTEDFNVQNDDKVQLYLRTTTASSYVGAGGLTVSIQFPFDKTSAVERTY